MTGVPVKRLHLLSVASIKKLLSKKKIQYTALYIRFTQRLLSFDQLVENNNSSTVLSANGLSTGTITNRLWHVLGIFWKGSGLDLL